MLDYLPAGRCAMAALIICFASMQISLVLHNESLREAFRAHWQFVRRNTFRFAWFLFICALHYWFFALADSVIRAAATERLLALLAWKLGYVLARALRYRLAARELGLSLSAMRDWTRESAKPGSDIRAMPSERSSAEEITRASKSNLAFAFVSLGKERRRDITIFYAFCRLIDDIADSTELAAEEKARRLTRLAGGPPRPASRRSRRSRPRFAA